MYNSRKKKIEGDTGHILRNILKKMNAYAYQLLSLNLSLVLTTATGQKIIQHTTPQTSKVYFCGSPILILL